jgi:CRP/FNR family transcriptional regulator, cyclic AMP receptor protein
MNSPDAVDLVGLLVSLGLPPGVVLALVVIYLLTRWTVRWRTSQGGPIRLRFAFRNGPRPAGVPVPFRSDAVPPDQWPYGTLVSRLDPDARRDLLGLGVPRKVPAGQILIHEGALDAHLVLLRKGLTKVTAVLPDGRTALLAIRVGGDLVGEMSALNKQPRSATITTCGPTQVSIIRMEAFKAFLKDHPDAALELAAMVADRLRWSNRRRIDFSSYPVKIRVARIIAELARTHGHRSPDGVIINVHLTQPELATICGAADTTIQKALKELRAEGLVETDYRRITVRDLDALREIGDLDPQS